MELARHAGQVVARDQLLDRVWGYDYLGDSRLVDVAIGRLRAKVEADPAEPQLILTVRGVGYKAPRDAVAGAERRCAASARDSRSRSSCSSRSPSP